MVEFMIIFSAEVGEVSITLGGKFTEESVVNLRGLCGDLLQFGLETCGLFLRNSFHDFVGVSVI